MVRKYLISFYLLLVSLAFAQHTMPEPNNIGVLKHTIKYYMTSGAYDSAMEEKYSQIKTFIEANMKPGIQYAVVMDVDETTLSNLEFELRYDFGFNPAIWKSWILEKKAKAISASLSFYKWAQAKNIAVFFVTGRRALTQNVADDPTYLNLITEGFTDFKKLYLKPSGKKISTTDYKSGARKEIESAGYTIIANIGDQWSDLEGGHAMHHFKLPNPMYFVQ